VSEALRRLGAEQAAADGDRGEVRLVAGTNGELGRAADQGLGVARGVDDGLRVKVDDGTLLLLQPCHCFNEFCSLGKILGAPTSGLVGLRDHAYREKAQIIRAVAIPMLSTSALGDRPDSAGGHVHLSAPGSLQSLQR
jgi:hypothetical protein